MAQILIIDDDEAMRYLLREMLEPEGYTVYEAANGAEGMRLFRQERPEFVITDVFMPEQDGLETIRMLKREFPTVKIVAMSGGGASGTLSYLEVTRTFGADRILRKPFLKGSLLATLQELGEESDLFD
jgi:CheY-like chemotaxis protein